MTNPNGMRMQNESDRTPEFKTGRDKLIADVNAFLDELRSVQAEGRSTKAGILAELPRMKHTSMGSNGPATHLLVTEFSPGAALYQQKPDEGGPFALEVVAVDSEKTEIMHVTGTPEVSRLLQEAVGADRDHAKGGLDVSFGVEDMGADGSSMYYRYDIMTDGAMLKQFVDMRGVNTRIPVSTAEGVQMAQLAFDQIKAGIV